MPLIQLFAALAKTICGEHRGQTVDNILLLLENVVRKLSPLPHFLSLHRKGVEFVEAVFFEE